VIPVATELQAIEAGALNTIASVIETESGAVDAFLASGEGAVQAGLVNLIKNIPSVKGAFSFVVAPIEAQLEAGLQAYAASVLAKYPPATIRGIVVGYLQNTATKIVS
jgi:hypothetical protein